MLRFSEGTSYFLLYNWERRDDTDDPPFFIDVFSPMNVSGNAVPPSMFLSIGIRDGQKAVDKPSLGPILLGLKNIGGGVAQW